MNEIDPTNIQIKFECDECGHTLFCNVAEAVYNGAPICCVCNRDNEMTIVCCVVS